MRGGGGKGDVGKEEGGGEEGDVGKEEGRTDSDGGRGSVETHMNRCLYSCFL